MEKIATWLAHIGWRKKILGFSALFIVLLLAIGGFGIYTMFAQNQAMRAIVENSQQRVNVAASARISIVEMELALANVVTAEQADAIRQQAVAAIRSLSLLDEQIQTLAAGLPGNAEVERLSALMQKIRPVQMQAIKAAKNNADAEAMGFIASIIQDSAEVNQISQQLMERERQALTTLQQESAQRIYAVIVAMLWLMGIGLLIGIGSSMLAANLVTRPLHRIEQAMTAVSEGDLRIGVDGTGTDEIARTATALAKTIGSLHKLISTIRAEAGALEQQSTQIGHSAQAVSAVSLKLHDSMAGIKQDTQLVHAVAHDMGEKISQASVNTQQSSRSSSDAAERLLTTVRNFEQFQLEMEATATSTRELSAAAQEVNQITETIQNISSQTNLLALNAAIEAARAGEQGRGFAVVADEVRNLAKRTEDATVEISKLIDHISHSIEQAVTALEASVADARANITHLTDLATRANADSARIDAVSHSMSEVADLMGSQRQAIEHIAHTVAALYQVSGDASRETEHLNSLSRDLRTAAADLSAGIQRFHL